MEGNLRTSLRRYVNKQYGILLQSLSNCEGLAKDLGDRWRDLERLRVEILGAEQRFLDTSEVTTESEETDEPEEAEKEEPEKEEHKGLGEASKTTPSDRSDHARARGAAQSQMRYLKQRYEVLRTMVTSYQRMMTDMHKDIEAIASDLKRMGAHTQFGLPEVDEKVRMCLCVTSPMYIINRMG